MSANGTLATLSHGDPSKLARDGHAYKNSLTHAQLIHPRGQRLQDPTTSQRPHLSMLLLF